MNMMLADALLFAHLVFVLFVVGMAICILIGRPLDWRWTRKRGLRYGHLAGVMFVAFEAAIGMACPLTVWEDALRGTESSPTGFIGRWMSRLLYYDWPAWVFTYLYLAFGLFVLWLLRYAPVERANRSAP